MNWNFKIQEAPDGEYVEVKSVNKAGKERTVKSFETVDCLIATKCGLRIVSRKLENGRWEFLAKDESPIAWVNIPDWPVVTPPNNHGDEK